jgi:hypothetical protein
MLANGEIGLEFAKAEYWNNSAVGGLRHNFRRCLVS